MRIFWMEITLMGSSIISTVTLNITKLVTIIIIIDIIIIIIIIIIVVITIINIIIIVCNILIVSCHNENDPNNIW